MTREEIIEGLKLLEDNMVYFDELLNDKGEYIDVHELLFEAIEVLEQEPCNNCDYKEWLKGEIEQEPCEDCISRKAILSRFEHMNEVYTFASIGDLRKVIGNMPSVQPKPKTGHWKKLNVGYGCSECSLATNKSGVDFYRFCPNRGAKMESEDKE